MFCCVGTEPVAFGLIFQGKSDFKVIKVGWRTQPHQDAINGSGRGGHIVLRIVPVNKLKGSPTNTAPVLPSTQIFHKLLFDVIFDR